MANARMTLGVLFGAVSATANAAVKSFNAINDGVDMLNSTIAVAALKQKAEQAHDLAAHAEQYALTVAQQVQTFHDELNDWLEEKADRRTNFQTTFDRLNAKAAEFSKQLT